jgi:hypothetical protein
LVANDEHAVQCIRSGLRPAPEGEREGVVTGDAGDD